MASRNTHSSGKPARLSPADLPADAEPVAYLTRALQLAQLGLQRPPQAGPHHICTTFFRIFFGPDPVDPHVLRVMLILNTTIYGAPSASWANGATNA